MYSYNVVLWICYDIFGFFFLIRLIYWLYFFCFLGFFTNGLKTVVLLVWGDCKVFNFEGFLAVVIGEGCDFVVVIEEGCVFVVFFMVGIVEDILVWFVCMWELEEFFLVLLEFWIFMVFFVLDFVVFNFFLFFWGIRLNIDFKINISRFLCFECYVYCFIIFKIVILFELLYYIWFVFKLNIY